MRWGYTVGVLAYDIVATKRRNWSVGSRLEEVATHDINTLTSPKALPTQPPPHDTALVASPSS